MKRDILLGILILLAVLFFVRRDTRERVSMTGKYNRLVHEKSPYLLQHKDNPVNWYAWGDEAFQAAKAENKPIFLSIGYSTCHWCHVMEHDSFERPEVAEVLNRLFISIKVDREERPDVDEIYMAAIHAMGQRGGWPLSMFLTPDLKPFYGGTYWPREQFVVILERLAQIWREQPEKVFDSGDQILEFLKAQKSGEAETGALNEKVFSDFFRHSSLTFDPRWGGFGAAPKFPHPMQLSLLLRIHRRTGNPEALEMAEVTLDKMARGGMYDHLGGGFARYSTDERWLVPHFEKMLYDNALLAKSYLEAFQITKNEMFASVAREILDYILRDMTHPQGGFYSAEDADSEGEEGKFYVWTEEDLKKHLSPEEFKIFAKVYGVTPEGNFEHGTNILSLQPGYEWKDKKNPLLQSAAQKLFSLREKRIRPHRDDKILTSWNGLMISAMALGYQVLGDPRYLEAAQKAADFILNRSGLREGSNLKARYRDGQARFPAYLDDYAFFIQGLLDLYECRFDEVLLKTALELQNRQGELFWDSKNGGFFFTDGSDKSLLVRSKEGIDSALPNGNAVSALNLLRLHDLTLQAPYREGASKIFRAFSKMVGQYPHAFSEMLIAYDYFTDSSKEIAVISSANDSVAEEFLKGLRMTFSPNKAIAQGGPGKDFPGLLKEKTFLREKTTFYVCEDQTCKKPTNGPGEALKFVQEYHTYKLNLEP